MSINKKRGITAGRALWITSHRDSTKRYNINSDLSSENVGGYGKRNKHRTPLVKILILGRNGMKEIRDWRKIWVSKG